MSCLSNFKTCVSTQTSFVGSRERFGCFFVPQAKCTSILSTKLLTAKHQNISLIGYWDWVCSWTSVTLSCKIFYFDFQIVETRFQLSNIDSLVLKISILLDITIFNKITAKNPLSWASATLEYQLCMCWGVHCGSSGTGENALADNRKSAPD